LELTLRLMGDVGYRMETESSETVHVEKLVWVTKGGKRKFSLHDEKDLIKIKKITVNTGV